MIEYKDVMPISFLKKEPFTGSYQGMRYRIEKTETPIAEDSDEKKICTLRVAEHYRCQGIATKLLKIAHQALQCTNPLITVSSIHINEFEFLLKKNGFTLYKKYENYYKQGIVEYAFNGLLPEKQNNCRMSQNVV